jgi:hypothetical protein
LWDVALGSELATFEGHGKQVSAVAFTADANHIVTAGQDGTVRLWHAGARGAQTSLIRNLRGRLLGVVPGADGDFLGASESDDKVIMWGLRTRNQVLSLSVVAGVDALVGSSHGSKLSLCVGDSVLLFDPVDGRKLHSFPSNVSRASQLAFSADEKLLAVVDKDGLSVYEIASGQRVLRLALPPAIMDGVGAVSFAGRDALLAAGGKRGTICVWDLTTERIVDQMEGTCGEIVALTCSRNGRLLASGNSDSTALVWKLPEPAAGGRARDSAKPAAPLPDAQEECRRLWNDLRASDARQAQKAIWSLVRSHTQALPYLAKQLRPVAGPDEKRISQDIADLENDRLVVRQHAFDQLKALGDLAVPALRRRLSARPSLELRRRLERLLFEAKTWRPDDLQNLRAIQVLEHIATPAARRVLAQMAQGAPESRLTREAKASLQRIAGS